MQFTKFKFAVLAGNEFGNMMGKRLNFAQNACRVGAKTTADREWFETMVSVFASTIGVEYGQAVHALQSHKPLEHLYEVHKRKMEMLQDRVTPREAYYDRCRKRWLEAVSMRHGREKEAA